MDRLRPTRRGFGALVALGALGLSGCLDDDEADDMDDEADDMDDEADDMDDEADDMDDENDDVDVDDQPDDAAAMFVVPEDGETVTSPVEIEADVENVDLAPAGEAVVGEGHLHVLVDQDCFDDGETIPGPSDDAEDDGIFHWGDGQSEGELDLEPGEYDLCLQLGDGPHRAFGETDEITITVEDE
ncbi:DUF4399 domain-containing protein [Halobacteria archaeon AArc-dxtr1]|nr:DUF4399 domain-containing protein [Halobacteria archaeon AArc-dxtr1]